MEDWTSIHHRCVITGDIFSMKDVGLILSIGVWSHGWEAAKLFSADFLDFQGSCDFGCRDHRCDRKGLGAADWGNYVLTCCSLRVSETNASRAPPDRRICGLLAKIRADVRLTRFSLDFGEGTEVSCMRTGIQLWCFSQISASWCTVGSQDLWCAREGIGNAAWDRHMLTCCSWWVLFTSISSCTLSLATTHRACFSVCRNSITTSIFLLVYAEDDRNLGHTQRLRLTSPYHPYRDTSCMYMTAQICKHCEFTILCSLAPQSIEAGLLRYWSETHAETVCAWAAKLTTLLLLAALWIVAGMMRSWGQRDAVSMVEFVSSSPLRSEICEHSFQLQKNIPADKKYSNYKNTITIF